MSVITLSRYLYYYDKKTSQQNLHGNERTEKDTKVLLFLISKRMKFEKNIDKLCDFLFGHNFFESITYSFSRNVMIHLYKKKHTFIMSQCVKVKLGSI